MKITIQPLGEADIGTADQIFRQAFSKFLGIPDPQAFTGDAAILATRWRADPAAALGAYSDGALVGSSLATRWGSFGFLGPVSVRPDRWDQGVAKLLVERTVALLDRSSIGQAALFTFPQSPKHIALLSKVRILAAVSDARDVEGGAQTRKRGCRPITLLSALTGRADHLSRAVRDPHG